MPVQRGTTPNRDIVLEVPSLKVDSIGLDVADLRAHVSLDAVAMNFISIAAGVDVVRLNFSHGDYDQKRELISNVRRVALELDKPVSILQDLQGPKIRVGKLAGDLVTLEDGAGPLAN